MQPPKFNYILQYFYTCKIFKLGEGKTGNQFFSELLVLYYLMPACKLLSLFPEAEFYQFSYNLAVKY